MTESTSAKSTAAMTLFEVAISMAIVLAVCASVLALLPGTYRVQERVRAQAIATAKILDMMETFSNQQFVDEGIGSEINPQYDTSTTGIYYGKPWDTHVDGWARTPDLESRLSSRFGGLITLPPTIARRIDSDNDDIQRILDAGGQVYYSNPKPSGGQIQGNLKSFAPIESQTIIYGFIGPAQLNALPSLPWKASPYYAPYPSPPDAAPEQMRDPWVSAVYSCTMNPPIDSLDTSIQKPDVDKAGWKYVVNTPDQNVPNFPNRAPEDTKRYAALGFWYAKLGYDAGELPLAFLTGEAVTDEDIELALSSPSIRQINVRRARFLAHAMITLTRHFKPEVETRIPLNSGNNQPEPNKSYTPENLTKGVVLAATIHTPTLEVHQGSAGALKDPVTLEPLYKITALDFYQVQSPSGPQAIKTPSYGQSGAEEFPRITLDKIVNYHANCMRLVTAWASRHPYDLMEPRPTNRAIMSDIPLFESDIQETAPLFGNITGAPFPGAHWRPITSINMLDPSIAASSGWSRSHPAMINGHGRSPNNNKSIYPFIGPGDDGSSRSPLERYAIPWGDYRRFTLTSRFDPIQRTRLVTAWVVNWQSYDDAETAPGAPMDASQYPIQVPVPDYFERNYNHPSLLTWNDRKFVITGRADSKLLTYRNPEKEFSFLCDMNNEHPDPAYRQYRETGDSITFRTARTDGPRNLSDINLNPLGNVSSSPSGRINFIPDQRYYSFSFPDLSHTDPRYIFSSCFGGDRNLNGRLDRGPISRHQRLRATTIARFLVYDPRLPVTFR